LKVRVLKASILSSENHHYIQSSSQTKQIPSYLIISLGSSLSNLLIKFQTSVEKFI